MGLPATRPKPRIYGHRGSRLRRPDNTIDSFLLALDEGADGVETDVRRLADGNLVLFNAETVGERLTRTLSRDELDRQLGVPVARPSDLSRIAGAAELVIEIKDRGCAERLVDEIGGLPSVVICSFDHREIETLARLRSTNSASFLLGVTIAGRMLDGPGYVRNLGAEWFFPASSFVDEETVAEFDAAGIPVVPWVVNHEWQWNAAADWGCHGFITDDPLAAARWRASADQETA